MNRSPIRSVFLVLMLVGMGFSPTSGQETPGWQQRLAQGSPAEQRAAIAELIILHYDLLLDSAVQPGFTNELIDRLELLVTKQDRALLESLLAANAARRQTLHQGTIDEPEHWRAQLQHQAADLSAIWFRLHEGDREALAAALIDSLDTEADGLQTAAAALPLLSGLRPGLAFSDEHRQLFFTLLTEDRLRPAILTVIHYLSVLPDENGTVDAFIHEDPSDMQRAVYYLALQASGDRKAAHAQLAVLLSSRERAVIHLAIGETGALMQAQENDQNLRDDLAAALLPCIDGLLHDQDLMAGEGDITPLQRLELIGEICRFWNKIPALQRSAPEQVAGWRTSIREHLASASDDGASLKAIDTTVWLLESKGPFDDLMPSAGNE